MTAPAPPILPWIPPAVRTVLLPDPEFAAACGGRVSTRLPSSVAQPFCTLQATAIPIDPSAGAWSPMVQVDGWCPPGISGVDPEQAAWRIAVAAARVLTRVRNVAWQNIRWSARITDGPLTDVDTARGESAPLYRAFIRAELRVHAS